MTYIHTLVLHIHNTHYPQAYITQYVHKPIAFAYIHILLHTYIHVKMLFTNGYTSAELPVQYSVMSQSLVANRHMVPDVLNYNNKFLIIYKPHKAIRKPQNIPGTVIEE